MITRLNSITRELNLGGVVSWLAHFATDVGLEFFSWFSLMIKAVKQGMWGYFDRAVCVLSRPGARRVIGICLRLGHHKRQHFFEPVSSYDYIMTHSLTNPKHNLFLPTRIPYMCPKFHGAVQLDDSEWSFGYCESGTGVYCCRARSNSLYTFRYGLDH